MIIISSFIYILFFKQKTAYDMRISGWSSDVCSSDLLYRIPNVIPTALYAAWPDPRAIPGFRRKPGELVVGSLAGLRAVKNLPMLLRACAGVPGKLRIVIVGEGPDCRCRSEEHTSEVQSLMRISYAVFCLKKKIGTRRRK